VRVAGAADFRRRAAIEMEAAWMNALAMTPVVVPAVVPNEAGQLVTVVDDADGVERGCVVLSWLAGTKLRWRFRPAHALALGEAAAHLHRNAARFVPPKDAWAKTWDPHLMCGARRGKEVAAVFGADGREVMEATVTRLEEAAAALGDTDWMLINADLGPHNTVFHRGAAGLFDFNDLGWGYAGFDLARYLHSLRWREGGEELVAAAIRGYESVCPTPPSWNSYGELFEVAAGLFLACYLAPKVDERGPETVTTILRLIADARGVVPVGGP